MDFEALADERQRVKELCRRHISSLQVFKYEAGPSFHVSKGEPEKKDGIVYHLTTTATCIESLEDCHSTFWSDLAFPEFGKSKEEALDGLKQAFYAGALKREKWFSEDSAPIYCATRALPLFLRCNSAWSARHATLVASIYEQLKVPERFGIGEKTEKLKPPDPEWYPDGLVPIFETNS
jgi:hypothetical protein